MRKDWLGYLQATKISHPRPLLVEAIQYLKGKYSVLDLGAGAMNDSRYLLDQGFKKIISVDAEPRFLDFCKELQSNRLTCIVSTFEKFDFPKEEYDIINAQFALPFNPPQTFNAVFTKIKESLKKDGILVGQFFGIKDDWAKNNPDMTFHSRKEVEKLLEDLEIIKLDEVEKDDKTALGPAKHWHLFNIIARKR